MMASALQTGLRADGVRGEILVEEPLARHTTWQIGGPAEALVTPLDRDDLVRCVRWARSHEVAWRILGNGSNLLVSDAGVRGLVILIKKVIDGVKCTELRVVSGAGASFPAVAHLAAAHGLKGLEFAAGIPGTVGGAVVMNAGWHEFETGNVVHSVDVLAGGEITTVGRAECGFGYRTSRFRHGPHVILSATFQLASANADTIRSEMEQYAASRRTNQPTALPSCGSVYLKPPGDFAGRLIDAAGLKGQRQGGIEVSSLHANFFINTGGGTCADALALMDKVEAEVKQQTAVRLTREVEFWE